MKITFFIQEGYIMIYTHDSIYLASELEFSPTITSHIHLSTADNDLGNLYLFKCLSVSPVSSCCQHPSQMSKLTNAYDVWHLRPMWF